ncbi:MAG: SET domain-containing protein [Spirochaetales bacterium]|nr:SET domain-containing protein [Spirochaetales bacterium]
MLYIKTEIRESLIPGAGEGLFSLEPVKKGRIIANLALSSRVMTEEEYQEEQRKGNKSVIQTAVRWVGNYFLYTDTIGNADYINHSSPATLLYHCGICFAREDIKAGDELTVDYRYFLAENDVYSFSCGKGNHVVDGLSGRNALLQSARELISLLKEADIQ